MCRTVKNANFSKNGRLSQSKAEAAKFRAEKTCKLQAGAGAGLQFASLNMQSARSNQL